MRRWTSLVFLVALLPPLILAQVRLTPVVFSAADIMLIQEVATLEFPWGMAFLPDARLLVTERPGRLRMYDHEGLSEPLDGLPAISYREGPSEQGGLMDVAVDPDFLLTHHIYLSYTEEAPPPGSSTVDTDDPRFAGSLDRADNRYRGGVVARATLDHAGVSDVQVIWRQEPKTIGRGHFDLSLVFGRDKTLFITSGDRMRFDPAQDMRSNLGKVVRINRDGSIPKNNPFVGRPEVRPDIWSLGHRNMLAAAVHPASGRLWVFEMGPVGGDELNIIRRGKNYGWPLVSDGDNYDKSIIPDHSTNKDFERPVRTWTPVISPSGALFYRGGLFPWRGNVIVGGLSSKALIRLTVEGDKVIDEERIDMERPIRDVLEAPDGSLLVITDAKNGELLRLMPRRGYY